MKPLILLAVLCFYATSSNAQLLKNLGEKAKQKIEQKAEQKVDKTIDDTVDGKKKTKTETSEGEVKVKTEDSETKVKTESKNPESLKAYSKYDFVQGEKIVSYEDFTRAEIGDFPTRWNTNGTAEIVTLNKKRRQMAEDRQEGIFPS